MTIIALDIQPQRCFTCVVDSENFVPYARQAVYELNKQAMYAHRRALVQNMTILGCGGFCIGADSADFECPMRSSAKKAEACSLSRSVNSMGNCDLLPGLPQESDYDYVMSYDDQAQKTAGYKKLFAWLEQEHAATVLIGGMPLEKGMLEMVLNLCKAGKWRVIVNLAASRGVCPEKSLQAILKMRRAGAVVLANANEFPVVRRHTIRSFIPLYQYA